jgi:hypothetical protein
VGATFARLFLIAKLGEQANADCPASGCDMCVGLNYSEVAFRDGSGLFSGVVMRWSSAQADGSR